MVSLRSARKARRQSPRREKRRLDRRAPQLLLRHRNVIKQQESQLKQAFTTLALAAALTLTCTAAQAEGCTKGAVVGGVAGHVAGGHGVAGAAAGCAIGHHEARKKDKEASAAAAGSQPAGK
jgi:hypothetical protein